VTIKPDCITCLLNQSLKVSKLLDLDEATAKRVFDRSAQLLAAHDLSYTPPQIAKKLYGAIAEITGIDDPIALSKERATQEALSVDTSFVHNIHDALKLSVIGNVIDFGAQNQFDLLQTIQKEFLTPFAIDDATLFFEALQQAKEMVVIGDNTGEHVFDKLLIEMIKKEYDIQMHYFVRGTPIINDVTFKEGALLSHCADIVDTGVQTPGYDLAEANTHSKEIFERADIVLAKGMGNFESLYLQADRPIFYLFIVKCSVVAETIGKGVKDMIFKKA
jgi:uncharacterized protein with ATP-grasp and redox domains